MNRFITITLLAVVIFMVFAMTACAKVRARLSNGQEISCRIYDEDPCGVSFYRCDDADHECQTNFQWLEH